MIVLADGSVDDFVAFLGEFDTKIALGSHASVLNARVAVAEASASLLENIHLTPELYTGILQFKGRLLIAICNLNHPPPKHILSKTRTLILKDTSSFSQVLEANRVLVVDHKIAFIHTWVCCKDRLANSARVMDSHWKT